MTRVEPELEQLLERLSPIGAVSIRPLAGGASSLTYVADVDDGGGTRSVVVKVAPAGLPPVRHRDVLRQSRVMRALASTAVPVPEVVWEDAGRPPEVPPLFAMSHIAGSSLEPLFDDARAVDGAAVERPAVVSQRMLNASATLADLHSIDPRGVDVGDGTTIGLDEEIERWVKLFLTIDASIAVDWRTLADRLRASRPAQLPPVIVHGDYRLGNMLADAEQINAVIDWEIWSVGDPRLDLGWFLINADPRTYQRSTVYADTMPSRAALIRAYTDRRQVETPGLAWFEAFACFKAASTWSLIVKHNLRRDAPDPAIDALRPTVGDLLRLGHEHLTGRGAVTPVR